MIVLAAGAVEGAVAGGGATLVTVGVLLLLYVMARGKAVMTEAGDLVMEYGWGFRGLAVVFVMTGVGLLGILIATAAGALTERDAIQPAALFGTAFLVMGSGSVVEGFRRKVVVGEGGISGRGWFGTAGPIPWEEVDEITFSKALSCFVVRGAGHTVRVSKILGGREKFIKECKKRLAKGVYGRVFKEHGKGLF